MSDKFGDGKLISLSILERRMIIGLLDIFAINAALVISLNLRPDIGNLGATIRANPTWFILLSGIWFIFALIFYIYKMVC